MDETKKPEDGPIPKIDDTSTQPAMSCALCGCSTPAVRCDRCNSQIFCLSCDDMYHKHPKRRLHLRKAVDSIWNSSRSPRLRRKTELPGDPSKIPIPPPRSKKKERHTIGGRVFLKSSHELGSFGYSKVFDPKHLNPTSRDVFAGQKSHTEGNYENESNVQVPGSKNFPEPGEIYENDNVLITQGQKMENSNGMDGSPWNRPNISSPIQVAIPSSSPDMMANGQSFGYPHRHQSRSAADLAPPIGTRPYPFHPHYPYLPPPPHTPYTHAYSHPNCAQCLSSSWSNLMSPHPSPFFHPVPWGSAHVTMAHGQGNNGHGRHSQGDLQAFNDPNFHFPYHPGAYYPNGNPLDPNFMKDMRQQTAVSTPKSKKSSNSSPGQAQSPEHSDALSIMETCATEEADKTADTAASQAKQEPEDTTPVIPKPTEPWSCVHCTYINPAGIHVCQVCCKTSHGTGTHKSGTGARDIDSPMELVNMDADANSGFLERPEMQKVKVI